MDLEKNYEGKIIKLHYQNKQYDFTKIGIVYKQDKSSLGTRLYMLLTDGSEWESYCKSTDTVTISAPRLDSGLRESLKNFYNAKAKHTAFLNNFWQEKLVHERNVSDAVQRVRDHSGTLSFEDFGRQLEQLFTERFHTSDALHHRLFFSMNFVGKEEVDISHVQEIQKYASPKGYSFIYEEYDRTLHIEDSDPSFKTFCEKHAPPIIPALRRQNVKIQAEARLGDKSTLMACRTYTLPLKFGLSKKSLEYIRENILDAPSRKNPLDQSISDAASRTTASSAAKKPKEQNHHR